MTSEIVLKPNVIFEKEQRSQKAGHSERRRYALDFPELAAVNDRLDTLASWMETMSCK